MMQIVIDIPEKDYKNGTLIHYFGCYSTKLDEVIYNGTPLPKGHGELVDIRPLMRGLYEEKCVGEVTYTTSEVYKMLDDETTTIIEADKENEE